MRRLWGRLIWDENDCLLWTGAKTKGYGTIWFQGKQWYVHRLAWFLVHGSVPEEGEPDHLCRQPACVNVFTHIEWVSKRENILRGTSPSAIHAQKTKCPAGHDYAERRNSRGERVCHTCSNARRRGSRVLSV